jgi:hypothetical protein
MATVMLMHWPGITEEQYETVRAKANWEGDEPDGGKLHVVGFDDDGVRILDVWESAEKFQAFLEARVMPVIEELQIETQPDVRFYPMHGIYAPAFGRSEQVATI